MTILYRETFASPLSRTLLGTTSGFHRRVSPTARDRVRNASRAEVVDGNEVPSRIRKDTDDAAFPVGSVQVKSDTGKLLGFSHPKASVTVGPLPRRSLGSIPFEYR